MADLESYKNYNREFYGDYILAPRDGSRPVTPVEGMIRYNTTTGVLENYNQNGWISIDAPPVVASVGTPTLSAINDTTTVNGSNFTATVVVKFIGISGTEYTPKSVVRNSSSQLTVTRPDVFPISDEPYAISVENSSGLKATLNEVIDAGGTPGFTTAAGSLGSFLAGNAVNVTVTTSDPDGTTNSITVASGSLPSGLSLTDNGNNTATISGTASNPGSTTTSNFTLRATDAGGNTSDRSFSMVVSPPMSISSSSTSGVNNAYTGTATNNELQRQGTSASNRKTLTINGSNIPTSGVSVTVGGQACSNISSNGSTITCTTPNATFGVGGQTVTVSESNFGQSVNSPNNITTRRYGENSNFPSNSGQTIQSNSDITNTSGASQYWIRPSGYGGGAFQMYVSGNRDGGGYDYYLITGGSGFTYYQQGNSCQNIGLQIAAPRSQGWWQGSQDIWGWRNATGNGGTTYVYKTGGGGNYTGSPFRQASYWGSGNNDWRVIDGGRWWVRNDNHNEPNGDYTGYAHNIMYGNNGYPMGWNDGYGQGIGGEYLCSTNAKP
jgi:hypothetical protein